ncbi:MAG TPA: class I SAM-dependent methyltransferase [Pyrinomonadaceae bacterium]|nr:class I SAM-dependent methyltransferase [Pyrinomonadaceae bacterium]
MATSFRDPAGQLLSRNGRIFRFVRSSAANELRIFLSSNTAQEFTDSHRLVRTEFLDPSSINSLIRDEDVNNAVEIGDSDVVVEHERIPFPNFPYEWAPEMLHAAGVLTLNLAEALLREGFGLKDATPYNVLFDGPNPVFIDLLSFEQREPTDPVWTPYAQFVRTFLLPLLVNKHFGLQLDQMLITRRDGLEPHDVYRLSSLSQKIRPEFMTLVSFPNWLGSTRSSNREELYRKRSTSSAEKAQFVLAHLLKGLRKKLDQVAPESKRSSKWSSYMASSEHLKAYFPEKEALVQAALSLYRPRMVLDVGCNTGHFSMLAANSGANVVAIDYDPVVIGQVWRRARDQNVNVLPLVVDLTRPTPSVGWRNEECPSFLERASGNFDAVFMLAVIHHMLVSERIPLSRILQLASEITTDLLIVEFVGPEDEMFRLLTRGRDHLHKDLTRELFETTARRFFDIVSSDRLGQSHRWIYVLRKKGVALSA